MFVNKDLVVHKMPLSCLPDPCMDLKTNFPLWPPIQNVKDFLPDGEISSSRNYISLTLALSPTHFRNSPIILVVCEK